MRSPIVSRKYKLSNSRSPRGIISFILRMITSCVGRKSSHGVRKDGQSFLAGLVLGALVVR
jgi:hypothetical protein